MTEQEILQQFQGIVAKSLQIDPGEVTPDAALDDLGAESLDLIEISMQTESEFNIWLPEKSILKTAEEIFGPGVLVNNGLLTETGKALLRRRLDESEHKLLDGEVTIDQVNKHFLKVKTWVRMIHSLVQQSPQNCEVCGGAMVASTGFRVKCKDCGREVTLLSGDELNREWVKQYYREEYEQTQAAPEAPKG
jgi:Acyl carrier protein